jgi:hypothetical protein
MISAFVLQEFGFGMQKVNKYRQGKNYSDGSAVMDKRGASAKLPLESSPFVFQFEYRINTEGYWTYDHMVLQFEDCVDVVKFLYPDYDYIFLFGHSCGHDRNRPDDLCDNSIRKGFGGKQPQIRETKIESDAYLG